MSETDDEPIDGRWRLSSPARDGEAGPRPARDELLGRDVVVWLLPPERELDASLAARVRVHHPALVQLHDARRAVRGPRDLIGRPYVVADPPPGAALAELLARGERLDATRLASLALDTLAALETLHSLGLAHGAVSPATLRLSPAGPAGAAGSVGAQALALDPLQVRTSAAPQAPLPSGPGPTSTARQTPARADLRALAEALYEAATGRRPDPAAPIPLRGLRPDLPAGVERVVLDLLEDGPGARGGPGLAAQARARLAEAAGLEAGPRPGVVEPRFVGRDDALADVAAAVDEAQALAAAGRAAREAAPAGASPAFVLVSAPAGLGKTRLLAEAAAAHARAGVRPLLLLAQAGADAYGPWRAALERAATWSDGAPAKEALAALLSPVLEPLVRHERVARALLALGARRPLLLLVDDGHRLSEAAAALLLHVARSAATPGAPGAAAVVVASRPVEAARPSPLLLALAAPLAPLHRAVPLEELPAVEAEELAASLLPEGTPRDEVERLARRGGGSPFLLGELAAQLRAAGPGGRAAATAPRSVQEALRVRLGRLGRDARALLDALAAVGRPLPAPAIEGVLLFAHPGDAGQPALLTTRRREARAELEALGLARPTEGGEEGGLGGLALRHGATREVALEALDPARARALAGAVLRALDLAAPLAAGDRARLALVAHEPGAAEAALAAATSDAAPDELLEAASQALPAGVVRARVQRDLARARLRRGAFQGARAAVAAALAEAGDDVALRAEAELIQGDAAFLEGDLRGAADAAGRGRAALAGPPSPAARGLGPVEARLLALAAKVATQRGDHAEAAARLAEARAAVGGAPGSDPELDALRDRLAVDEATAWVLALDRARYAEARTRIEAAVRAREAAGDEAGLLHAERALGMHAYYAGDMPRAEACFKAALGRCERVADPSLAAGLWNNLGLVAREQGALRRAEVALERALDLAERLGQAAVLCRALTNVGRVRRSLGDLRGAARSFRRAAAVAATGGDAVIESAALTELGAARLEAGRPRAALAAIGRGLAIRRARGDAGRVGESCLELGEVWRAAGDPRAALTCAARALALHAALGNAEAAAAAVEAMEAAAGRPGGPAAALEEAHRGVRVAGPPALRAAAARGERLARLARRALAAAVAARAGDAELALVHARRVRRLARAVERQADLTPPVRALGASLALEARALVLEGGPGAAAALDRALALADLPAARKVALRLRRALTAEPTGTPTPGPGPDAPASDAGLPRGLAQRRDVLRALVGFHAAGRAGSVAAATAPVPGLAEARESARRLGDVALLAALADARATALARSGDDEAHAERALAEQALARLTAGLPATLARGLSQAFEPLTVTPPAPAPAPTAPAARALEALDAAATVEVALARALEAAAEATGARRGLALPCDPGDSGPQGAGGDGAARWSAEQAAGRGAVARHGLAADAPPAPSAWGQVERAARDGLAVVVRSADGAALAVPARAARRTLAVLWLERSTPFDDAARASAQAVAARLARALVALAPAARARGQAPERTAPGADRPGLGLGRGGDAGAEGEGRLIGGSPPMRAVHRLIERYGRTTAPVTIHGESGTGKELVASALHRASPRREGPFVAFNCSAVTDTLLESELFGVVKGAFTGADRDRKGLFELAHGGTLFMDEVGDMTLDMQSKLLRVLETGELRPVGGRQVVTVDSRIISATHHDLRRLVSEGRMREDLFYRLNVLRIELPPLRERREDIPLLAAHILAQAALTHGGPPKRLAPEALDLILRHPFPGNVRELKNVLERACVLEPGPILGAGRLLLDGPPAPGPSAGAAAYQRVFSYQGVELNRRQRQVLDHLEAGAAAVTNREFCAMASVSERTGLRDLAELVERGVLVRLGKRKGARYRLATPPA